MITTETELTVEVNEDVPQQPHYNADGFAWNRWRLRVKIPGGHEVAIFCWPEGDGGSYEAYLGHSGDRLAWRLLQKNGAGARRQERPGTAALLDCEPAKSACDLLTATAILMGILEK
jgi:hypothetical protein